MVGVFTCKHQVRCLHTLSLIQHSVKVLAKTLTRIENKGHIGIYMFSFPNELITQTPTCPQVIVHTLQDPNCTCLTVALCDGYVPVFPVTNMSSYFSEQQTWSPYMPFISLNHRSFSFNDSPENWKWKGRLLPVSQKDVGLEQNRQASPAPGTGPVALSLCTQITCLSKLAGLQWPILENAVPINFHSESDTKRVFILLVGSC